jgi:hypothetical protein
MHLTHRRICSSRGARNRCGNIVTRSFAPSPSRITIRRLAKSTSLTRQEPHPTRVNQPEDQAMNAAYLPEHGGYLLLRHQEDQPFPSPFHGSLKPDSL